MSYYLDIIEYFYGSDEYEYDDKDNEEYIFIEYIDPKPDYECPICYLSKKETDKKFCKLDCNHIFHEYCIEKWFFHKTNIEYIEYIECPYCKKILN